MCGRYAAARETAGELLSSWPVSQKYLQAEALWREGQLDSALAKLASPSPESAVPCQEMDQKASASMSGQHSLQRQQVSRSESGLGACPSVDVRMQQQSQQQQQQHHQQQRSQQQQHGGSPSSNLPDSSSQETVHTKNESPQPRIPRPACAQSASDTVPSICWTAWAAARAASSGGTSRLGSSILEVPARFQSLQAYLRPLHKLQTVAGEALEDGVELSLMLTDLTFNCHLDIAAHASGVLATDQHVAKHGRGLIPRQGFCCYTIRVLTHENGVPKGDIPRP